MQLGVDTCMAKWMQIRMLKCKNWRAIPILMDKDAMYSAVNSDHDISPPISKDRHPMHNVVIFYALSTLHYLYG